jgi:SPP1 gp7 family putative phage head morphogenesis protein
MAKSNKMRTNTRNGGLVQNTAPNRKIHLQAEKSDLIVKKIVGKATNRTRRDIQRWITAVQSAEKPENPRRQELLSIYESLIIDNHLSSQMDIRRLKTLHTPFRLLNEAGEPDWELTKLIQKQWMHILIGYIVDSAFFGHSLIELEITKPKEPGGLSKEVRNAYIVPRRHVIQERGLIRVNEGDDSGFEYRNVPTFNLIESGDNLNLGLLMKAAPAVMYKRNAMAAWSEFAEIFGMPIRIGKTRATDPKARQQLEMALAEMGSAAYAVLDVEDEIELKEVAKSDSYKVYDMLIERTNSELSKLILGVTMLSDNGSSRSQSEVHERVADDIVEADRAQVKYTINDQLIPLLIKNGYPLQGMTFDWDLTSAPPLKDQWEIISGLLDKGFIINPQYIEETFGVPIDGREERTLAPINEPDPDPDEPSARYNPASLLGLTGYLKGILKAIMPGKTDTPADVLPCGCVITAEAALPSPSAEDDIEAILAPYKNEKVQDWSTRIYDITNRNLQDAVEKAWGGRLSGIDYDHPDHLYSSLMEASVMRFGYDKTLTTVLKLNEIMRNTDSFDAFKEQATKLLDQVNVNYLKTEYNFAVASAQNGAAWIRAKQNTQFPIVIWRTMQDGVVRPEHAKLHGKKFDMRDGTWTDLTAPLEYGCRCYMDQDTILDSKADSSRQEIVNAIGSEKYDKLKKAGMLFNSGELAQVFGANQSYSGMISKNQAASISQLTPESNGLPSYQALKSAGLPSAPAGNFSTRENARQAFDILRGENEAVKYRDFKNRAITLSTLAFEKSIQGEGFKHFNLVESTLLAPDEGWFKNLHPGKNGDAYQVTFVKLYDGKTFNVDVEMNLKKGIIVKSWKMVSGDADKKTRRGVFLKTK